MTRNKYNGNSSPSIIPTNRIERLLRERELRKSNKDRGGELSELVLRLKECDNSNGIGGVSYLEQYLEAALAFSPRSPSREGGWERPSGSSPFTQRLLVVANRLPVTAVRRGEESWSLDISAGGLVSALLGVKEFEARWIGWTGVNVPDEPGQKALTKALAEKEFCQV